MKALNFEAIFNLPYSPENNPIETVFSLIKHEFKKNRLHHLASEKKFDFKDGVVAAISSLKDGTVKNICRGVFDKYLK